MDDLPGGVGRLDVLRLGEHVSDRCQIGWSDWTRRHRCGKPSAIEVRVSYAGNSFAWASACYAHADELFAKIAQPGREAWSCETRAPAMLREVLDYRAEVVPIGGSRP